MFTRYCPLFFVLLVLYIFAGISAQYRFGDMLIVVLMSLVAVAAVYLLMALAWAFLYRIITEFHPDAFTVGDLHFYDLLYFSVTTLTTLGYGDISPVAPVARMTAILEAALGVLYTAILIGRLMGIHIAGANRDR